MENTQYLAARGLMNAGLVELTPTLTKRYNECLISMGLQPTGKEAIHVDGVGWSPEVAQEQKNPFYLCNGASNPVIIIVSPDQFKKPDYFPIFSWMRKLTRLVFDKYHREIIDITATNVVSLDIENGLSSLVGPEDLLVLSEITVMPNISAITEAARKQKMLVAHFSEGLNCLEPECRDQLIESREQYGDLRKRRLSMQPVSFDLFNDFYTIAFEGAAVLRGVGDKDLLVLESQVVFESIKKKDGDSVAEICYLYDPNDKPFQLLKKAGMIEVQLQRFRENPQLLDEKKDLLLALALCDAEPDLEWNTLNATKRKSLMRKHQENVPEIFGELERFIASLKRGTSVPKVSSELWYFLATPSERLPPGTQEVLWILLTRKEPRNILQSYTYDKNNFFAKHSEWSAAKQKWVAHYLAERYRPRMKQP